MHRQIQLGIVSILMNVQPMTRDDFRQFGSVETIRLMQYSYNLIVNSYRNLRNFVVLTKRMANHPQRNNVIILGLQPLENRIHALYTYLSLIHI